MTQHPEQPGPNTRQPPTPEKPWLDVVLSFTGKTFVAGQNVSLSSHLQSMRNAGDLDHRVRLFANPHCRFDHVTEVFRTCKQHGLEEVILGG
ncbi:MAG: hypothetical protein COA78_10440 [Blastopirellula sp.]|nr:MAG: hypothetical protein COA78_10440 [Blastopirellula sp.]